MKKVTIQDVAKELNLSRNTVAKALNNSDTVAYETRYVVIEKAYEMGYTKISPLVMNEFKLKNKTEEPKTIVVLTRREISIFWNRIIMGISDELNKYSCKLQLNFISEEDEKNLLLPVNVDDEASGIIILSVFSREYIRQIEKKNIPVVYLDAPSDVATYPLKGDILYCEGNYSIRQITKHLLDQGVKDIGFIGDITYCKTIADRYNGFIAAMADTKTEIDYSIIAASHKPRRYYYMQEVKEALESFSHIPRAIVCANDDIAMDVIRCLKQKGYQVPQDVAVTGYDNVEDLAQLESILTTVRVGNQRLGRRLVQQLLFRIKNPEFPMEMISVGVEVIYRESSRIYH